MDLFNLAARLTLDSSDYERGLKGAEEKSSIFSQVLKANLVTKGVEVCVRGLAKLGSAAANVFKGAIDGYADYEQLVGGVETLFKKSADTVMKNAEQAYKNAGMSANEYMETVTSFSASLIQSLGGNTQKAADMADLAIQDMSDNANKMGSDMSSIQNAYQGFAKQNYTMLDNLKLGYGGTKEEMERLVKDAAKIDKSFKYNTKTVVKNKKAVTELDMSYADIVRAIHIVQTNIGITGTTAEEASKTISGSMNMLKAAWQNLVTGMGEGNEKKLDKLVDDVVDAAKKALTNVLPVAEKAVYGILHLVEAAVPVIVKEIPKFLDETLPVFVDALTSLFLGVVRAVPAILSKVIPKIASSVVKQLPKIYNAINSSIRNELIPGIAKLIGEIFGLGGTKVNVLIRQLRQIFVEVQQIVGDIASIVAEFWNTTLQPILTSIVSFVVKRVVPDVRNAIGEVQPIIESVTTLLSRVFGDITNLWFNTLFPMVSDAWKFITESVIPNVIYWITEKLLPTITTAYDNIVALWTNTLEPVVMTIWETVVNKVGPAIIDAISWIIDNIGLILPIVEGVVAGIAALMIGNKIAGIMSAVTKLFSVIMAHPFAIVIGAIVALVGYLVYLYNTNEEARDKINAAWEAVKTAIQIAIDAIVGFWENTLRPALEALYTYVVTDLIPTLIVWWEYYLQPAIERVFTAIAGFWENTLKPALVALYDYVYRDLIPTLIVWWEYHLQPAIEGVFSAIAGFWNDILKPALEAIYTYVVTDLIPTLIVWWEYELQPAIQRVFEAIKNFWETILKPAFEAVRDFVLKELIPKFKEFGDYVSGKFMDAWKELKRYWKEELEPRVKALKEAIDTFYKKVIKPVADYVAGTFYKAWKKITDFFSGDGEKSVSGISGVFDTLLNTWLKPIAEWLSGAFSTAWENVKTMLNGLVDFITNVFSGNWRGAWDSLVDMVGTIFGRMKDLLKAPINAVIDMINSMIDKIESAINWVINGINSHLRVDVDFGRLPDFLGGGSLGGIHWGANLSNVQWSRIARLWQGGMLSEGQEALVGEYAPEHLKVINGKAIVTPLSNKPGRLAPNNNISINVYPQPGQSPEQIAEQVQRVLNRELMQRQVAHVV